MQRTSVWHCAKVREQRGASLIEVLVAVLINSLFLAGVVSFFSFQSGTARAQDSRRAAQVTSRETVDFLVRHISGIGRANQTRFTDAAPAIIEAEADSIHYQTNLSEDWTNDDVNDPWEEVHFWYDASTRAVWFQDDNTDVDEWLTDAGARRKSYVPAGGLAFTYYDGDGNVVAPGSGAAARASIRRINIALTVRGILPGQALGSTNEPEATMSQDVFLRNVS